MYVSIILLKLIVIVVAQVEIDVYRLKQTTETVSGSSGSLPMSGRNGSASDADCRISEDPRVPDVELMELGPLLEEGGGRQAASKGVHSEVDLRKSSREKKFLRNYFCELLAISLNVITFWSL